MSEPVQQPNQAGPPGAPQHPPASHWHVLRDVVALQFKLALDGLLDLMLSPVSIVAAIVGLIANPDNPGKFFYRVLRFGHRTDKWINLYGAGDTDADDTDSADLYVRKVEDLIRNEYHKGGMVKSIKDNTDGLIDRIRKRD